MSHKSTSKKEWEESTLKAALSRAPDREADFTTVSGQTVPRICTPEDIPAFDTASRLGYPGEYPYTRGIYPSMYRGKLWTMRQFSGFGTAEETNTRYKFLLAGGQTGLSVAFDLPTLMGLDSDDPTSAGEIGRCGVAVDTLADMEVLFAGIDLETITTSMTINAPAAILVAMIAAVAEKQGADLRQISGTTQNDILKEYIAQKEWIFPPQPSMRLVVDTFEWCAQVLPRWNSISISGYHIREAGATAAQELAFTLRDGIEYVHAAIDRGLPVDSFAPRLSFFFNAHNDFFEEIAKYRAARRIWAVTMRERFGAQNPASWLLRFHTQTAGCTLTAQQPYNNVARVAIQALAAVLGGTQSLHTNALDETLALPTEFSAQVALRTQQIIALETGVANTIDPLGGSYFVEALTDRMEQQAWDYIGKIDRLGGMVAAIEAGFPQKEIQDAAYRYQQALERNEKFMVGVNIFAGPETAPPPATLSIDEGTAGRQLERLGQIRSQRDPVRLRLALDRLHDAAAGGENTMPAIFEAVKAYASVGEIVTTLKAVFGVYSEPLFV